MRDRNLKHPYAERVIDLCGGVAPIVKAGVASRSWVFRWRLPKERGGTDGDVPREAQIKLVEAGRAGKLPAIDPSIFFPEEAPEDGSRAQ